MLKDYRKSLPNIVYLFLLQALNFVIPIIILPYLLKTLGPDKFGVIGFGQAVAQYFILIVDFGFNLSAVKKISVNRDDVNKLSQIFWSTMYAKIILCAVCFIINLILIYSVPKFYAIKDVLYIYFFMVTGFVIFPVWFFQGIEKIKLITLINLFVRLLVLPATFLFIKHPSDYKAAAIIQSLSIICAGLISFCFIYYYHAIKFYAVNLKYIRDEIKESWPVFLSNAAINIYTSSFVVILGLYATTTAVGYYTTADKVTRAAVALILMPVSQALYPRISYLAEKDKVQASVFLKYTFVISSIVLVFVSAALFFASNLIIHFLGSNYKGALLLLQILSCTPLLIGLAGILGQLGLLAFGDKTGFKNIYLTCGAASIPTVIVLTLFFKEQGTAIALVITELLAFILMYKRARHFMKIQAPINLPKVVLL